MTAPPPIRVSGRRIQSVRVTGTGWAFIVFTLGLGFGGLNSGNNLLYLVFGMFLSLLLLNAILSRASLHNLSARIQLPTRLFANVATPVHLTLANENRRIASYALTTRSRGPVADPRGGFILKVGPGRAEDHMHSIRFPARGRQPLPAFELRSSHPFGLIEKIIPIVPEGTCVVFPVVRRLDQPPPDAGGGLGDFLSRRRGEGQHPYGVRAYREGDELRHIHWPTVARTRRWMTREFEEDKRPRVTVRLATPPPRDEHDKALRETLISEAASWVVRLFQLGREVDLEIDGRLYAPQGSGYLDYYLTVLALFDDGATPPFASHPPARDGTAGAVVEIPPSTPAERSP